MQAQAQPGWLETEQIGATVVARFTTRRIVSEEKMLVLGRQLFELGEAAGHGRLVLNFEAVERLSSAMLGKVIGLQRRVEAKGGQLALCGISSHLRGLFKSLKLARLVTIYETEQEALQGA